MTSSKRVFFSILLALSMLVISVSVVLSESLHAVPVASKDGIPNDAPYRFTAKRFDAISGTSTIVAPPRNDLGNQNHGYLHHDGRQFWAMWSSGPPVEGEPGQEVRYSTSTDGFTWTTAKILAEPRSQQHGLIARGFWTHPDGLRALISEYRGKGAFGLDKELVTFYADWNGATRKWERKHNVFDGQIPNYPPIKFSGLEWLALRKTDFSTSAANSKNAGTTWKNDGAVPNNAEFDYRPDEPVFFLSPNDNLCMALRNNGADRRLFFSCRIDQNNWTPPAPLSIPNGCSKTYMTRLADKRTLIVGNFEPDRERSLMHIAIADHHGNAQRVFRISSPSQWRKMGDITRLQYPHAIELDGKLILIYSVDKQKIEVMHLSMQDLDSGSFQFVSYFTTLAINLQHRLWIWLHPGLQFC